MFLSSFHTLFIDTVNTQVQSLNRKICNYTYLQIYLLKSYSELKLNPSNNLMQRKVEIDKRKWNLIASLLEWFKNTIHKHFNSAIGMCNLTWLTFNLSDIVLTIWTAKDSQ